MHGCQDVEQNIDGHPTRRAKSASHQGALGTPGLRSWYLEVPLGHRTMGGVTSASFDMLSAGYQERDDGIGILYGEVSTRISLSAVLKICRD